MRVHVVGGGDLICCDRASLHELGGSIPFVHLFLVISELLLRRPAPWVTGTSVSRLPVVLWSAAKRILDPLERSEEYVLVGVPAQESQDDPPPGLDDERGYADEGVNELLEFHAHERLFLRLVLLLPATRLGESERAQAFSDQASAAITM